MNKILKWAVAVSLIVVFGYLLSVTIVDACLMGVAFPRFSYDADKSEFLIEDSVRIDSQDGFKCSAYSSAYILRHWGAEAHGEDVYKVMPDKMEGGYVYPKGIVKFLESNGFTVGYHIGNIVALKNELAKGDPVIVMIKIRPDRDWLHYVPVVGYSADSLYIAESIPDLCNVSNKKYNRSISTDDFETLWNTRALKMPLYGNTFITARK